MYEQQIVSLFIAAILLGSGLLHVDGPLGLYINPKLLKSYAHSLRVVCKMRDKIRTCSSGGVREYCP